ncbi:MAG: Holliday junction branch migration protein RuvA [Rhodothermales bacterium]|nr:Holliday junction branch migration protein RuvA [Rhodothermales bacterium]
MITYVSGKLVSKKATEVVIDVQGIGYEIRIPTSTYEKLPDAGKQAILHTHHYIREDAALLYGFADVDQRSIFEAMMSVSGVGPKLALAALSAFPPADLREHVVRGDVGVLTGIPGVGRKTAERLVVELRDKFARVELQVPAGGVAGAASSLRGDALSALEALGLSRAGAERSISRALKEHPGIDSVEELVRYSLQGG